MSIFVILLNQNGNKAFDKANKEHLIILLHLTVLWWFNRFAPFCLIVGLYQKKKNNYAEITLYFIDMSHHPFLNKIIERIAFY